MQAFRNDPTIAPRRMAEILKINSLVEPLNMTAGKHREEACGRKGARVGGSPH
jgi:hypothetical protein